MPVSYKVTKDIRNWLDNNQDYSWFAKGNKLTFGEDLPLQEEYEFLIQDGDSPVEALEECKNSCS